MNRLFILLSVITLSYAAQSQDGSYYLGASSSGMSNAYINTHGAWGLFNNPASLGFQDAPAAITSYQNRYNIPSFQSVGLGMVYPTKIAVAGISAYRFGDDAYNQQKIALSIASNLQFVSLGLGVHYLQHRFDELGSANAIVIDFGGIVEFIEGFRIGAHVFNVNQARLSETIAVPTIMRIGLSYTPSDNFIITTELEKDLDLQETIKIGMDYHIIDWVTFRTGFSSTLRSFSFGLGIAPIKFIHIDYSFVNNSPAGIIHEFSLAYQISKK